MKLALIGLLCLTVNFAFASSVKWQNQDVGKEYKLNIDVELQLDEQIFKLPSGTKFDLLEKSDLNMIKVHLHKYKIDNCPAKNIETDLQLIPVNQGRNRKTSVGVNLIRGCIVEIFINMKEYNTLSLLN